MKRGMVVLLGCVYLIGSVCCLDNLDDIPWYKEQSDIVELSDESLPQDIGEGYHVFVNFYTKTSILAKQLHSHYKHLARLFHKNKDFKIKVGRMSIEDYPEFSSKLQLDEETSIKYFKPKQFTSKMTYDGDKTCFLQLFKWSIQFLDDKAKTEISKQFDEETGHEKDSKDPKDGSDAKCKDDPVKIIKEGIKDLNEKVLDLEKQIEEELKIIQREGVLLRQKSQRSPISIVIVIVGAILLFSAFIVCSRIRKKKPVNIV